MANQQPYVTIRSRRPTDTNGFMDGGPSDMYSRSATHDISRTAFHVKHIGQFARRLEDSAARAFPNRGRPSQRYKSVQALLLHWASDDLFVLPELEDLEKCLREHYGFGTDIFAIPSENAHLMLMMRIGQLLQGHEGEDTLFVVYYGGHARIDESRQSTWCANRDPDSPWLQWSAIQTLLERSRSDVLILLDCCAGAASATFPTGNSITETISASSWNAIAPDPGRYSFTNALIEILQEWQMRAFSAAMLHAELLARLKHPRPVAINGKLFEARSTPVHFMMTSNHRAPSIELSRIAKESFSRGKRPSPPTAGSFTGQRTGREAVPADAQDAHLRGPVANEPTEDTPHVMISLALEDDQKLDIHAWEQWLSAFPALAKYVKIQGVFKSHSTLMLVSLPVMIWDLLPEDPATSFVAFIRSNNIAAQKQAPPEPLGSPAQVPRTETVAPDTASLTSGLSGTTIAATESSGRSRQRRGSHLASAEGGFSRMLNLFSPGHAQSLPVINARPPRPQAMTHHASANPPSLISRQMIFNKQQSQRRTTFGADVPQPKSFAAHVEKRLEEYYHLQPFPSEAESAFIASNLGIEPFHLEVWYHHRRERDAVRSGSGTGTGTATEAMRDALEILPGDLQHLLEISPPCQTLLLDTRPPGEYQKTHIHGAVNFRIPQSFMKTASVEMLEQSFTEKHARYAFSGWKEAKCIVFYSRGLNPGYDARVAACLWQKLSEHGWSGRIFILRGSYDDLAAPSSRDNSSIATGSGSEGEPFDQWLALMEKSSGSSNSKSTETAPSSSSASKPSETGYEEQSLECEFQARRTNLHSNTQGKGEKGESENSDMKAHLVESLDRGLDKLRNAPEPPNQTHSHSHSHSHSQSQSLSKWAEGGKMARDDMEEYIEVDCGKDEGGEEVSRRGFGLLDKVLRRG